MAQQNVPLQFDELLGRHRFVLKLTEAGGHAIDVRDPAARLCKRFVILADDAFDMLATLAHTRHGRVTHAHRDRPIARDLRDLLDRERFTREFDCLRSLFQDALRPCDRLAASLLAFCTVKRASKLAAKRVTVRATPTFIV
jgi:hypothetical protein